MNYTAISFNITPFSEDIADAIIAEMGNIGYDGFQYTETGFIAYITSEQFCEENIQNLDILQLFPTTYHIGWNCESIENRDWNKEWEEHFTPVNIQNRILIRAGFHPTIPGIEHEIIIEPKMSFGTGHHATTALMLETLLDFTDLIAGQKVLDMGCGTGILSIMAAQLGASQVTGIDIDEWSFNNAMENIRNNNQNNISIKIGDAHLLENESDFNFILANINRNILLADMEHYVQHLVINGYLLMSGFYIQDLPLIREKAENLGLTYENHKINQNWVAVSFHKK